MKISRILAIVATLLFAAAPAYAQMGTPTLGIDRSGSTRCTNVWDLNNPGQTKWVPFGCIDVNGAWNLPAALRNVKQIDETVLRGLGYVGDGSSHQLVSVTSLNGRSTNGWSLTQWQAVLPAATALTDEIDGAVINSVIAAAGSNVKITLGPGKPLFSHPLASACHQNVSIVGAGVSQTILQFGATDGWTHCLAGYNTGGADSLVLKDIQLLTTDTTSTSNYGVHATTLGGHFQNFKLTGFNSGMLFLNAGGVTIEKGFIYSGRPVGSTTVGNGVEFQGTYSFVNHIFDNLVQNYNVGYRFLSTPTSGQIGIEDVRVVNSAAGATNLCVEITSSLNSYSPLDYAIENFSCDTYSGYVNAQAVNQLTIRGGNWLVHPPVGTWGGSGNDMFRLCRIASGRLENAYATGDGNPGILFNSYVHAIANGSTCGAPNNVGPWDFKVINNHFDVANTTATTAYLIKDNLASAVVYEGNQFTNAYSPIDTLPTNAYSWSQFDTSSALFQARPGEPRNATNTIAATSGSTQNVMSTFALPPGRWWCSPSLLVAPTGATVTQIIFGMNTTTALLPTPPFQGSHVENGSWTGNQNRGGASYYYDFSAASGNTTLYLVENLTFTGGTVNAQGAIQCVRLR